MHVSAQFWKRAGLLWGDDSGSGRGPASLHTILRSPARLRPHHLLELVLEERVQPLDPVRVDSTSRLAPVCLYGVWSGRICWWCCSSQAEMHRMTSVSSEQLEHRYQEYLQGQEDAGVKFSAGNRFYELRFRGLFCVETILQSSQIQHTISSSSSSTKFVNVTPSRAFKLRPPILGQSFRLVWLSMLCLF